jgi:hypothetical protein
LLKLYHESYLETICYCGFGIMTYIKAGGAYSRFLDTNEMLLMPTRSERYDLEMPVRLPVK